MVYFIDTNIFIRVLVKDNEKIFQDCKKFLTLISKGKIKAFTSALVLSEVNWVLDGYYQFEKEKVIEGLRGILKLKNLRFVEKFNLPLAVELYEKYPIKFIDALLASNPKIYKKEAIVVSYDKDFDKIGIKRKEPSQII
jgi:predicted nucleic acid-binding protein